jgi:hypothetical protein
LLVCIAPNGHARRPPGLGNDLEATEPDALAEHYDAAKLDGPAVYPACWQKWEETFDPLGQVWSTTSCSSSSS